MSEVRCQQKQVVNGIVIHNNVQITTKALTQEMQKPRKCLFQALPGTRVCLCRTIWILTKLA